MELTIGERKFKGSLPTSEKLLELLYKLPVPPFGKLLDPNDEKIMSKMLVFVAGESVCLVTSDPNYNSIWTGSLDSCLVVILRGHFKNPAGALEEVVVAFHTNAAFQINWQRHFDFFVRDKPVTMQILGGFGQKFDIAMNNICTFCDGFYQHLQNLLHKKDSFHLQITHGLVGELNLNLQILGKKIPIGITNIKIALPDPQLHCWNPELFRVNVKFESVLYQDKVEFPRRLREYVGSSIKIAHIKAEKPTSLSSQVFIYITGQGPIFIEEFKKSDKEKQIKLLSLHPLEMIYVSGRFLSRGTEEALINYFLTEVGPKVFTDMSQINKEIMKAWATRQVSYTKAIHEYNGNPSPELLACFVTTMPRTNNFYGPYAPGKVYGGYRFPPSEDNPCRD